MSTLRISQWISRAVLQGALNGLASMGSWHRSSSLQLSTHPFGLGGPQGFAALTLVSLHSQSSAAARFVMWGCWELPSPMTCPSCCQISHLSTCSSQGCSDKPRRAGGVEPQAPAMMAHGQSCAIQHVLSWAQAQMFVSLKSFGCVL